MLGPTISNKRTLGSELFMAIYEQDDYMIIASKTFSEQKEKSHVSYCSVYQKQNHLLSEAAICPL